MSPHLKMKTGDVAHFDVESPNHLTEVVRSKPGGPVYLGKRHIPPRFGPFWAYSCTYLKGLNCLFDPL